MKPIKYLIYQRLLKYYYTIHYHTNTVNVISHSLRIALLKCRNKILKHTLTVAMVLTQKLHSLRLQGHYRGSHLLDVGKVNASQTSRTYKLSDMTRLPPPIPCEHTDILPQTPCLTWTSPEHYRKKTIQQNYHIISAKQ